MVTRVLTSKKQRYCARVVVSPTLVSVHMTRLQSRQNERAHLSRRRSFVAPRARISTIKRRFVCHELLLRQKHVREHFTETTCASTLLKPRARAYER